MLDYSQLALLLNQMHLNLNRDQIDTVMNKEAMNEYNESRLNCMNEVVN